MLKNIKSQLILKKLFQYVPDKIKLNLIKHNKSFIQKLGIEKEDFKIYEIIKNLNKKFDLKKK